LVFAVTSSFHCRLNFSSSASAEVMVADSRFRFDECVVDNSQHDSSNNECEKD
jgi:hypothetical protein